MSADRFESTWNSPIPIPLDGNTESAFDAELVTAGSAEIGMGFVPISIRRQAVNRHPVPGIALRAVLLEGAGNFVQIVPHRCAPSFQAEPNEPISKLGAVRQSCAQDTLARVTLKFVRPVD